MKRSAIILTITGLAFASYSQQQIENGDFENWENQGTAEEEPVDWSSLKTADALASTTPSVLSQDTGRGGGTCAKLEVKEVFGIKANGIMTNGRVHADFNPENGYVYTDPNDPQWYTECSDRPDSIVGWYKYEPQNGDKGKIEVILHINQGNLPFNGTENNMIGRAKYEFTSQQTTWTRFSKEFTYVDQQNPTYILTTIASGDSTISETGSTLWIDDISLVYNTSQLLEESNEITSINAAEGFLMFNSSVGLEKQYYKIHSISGALIQEGTCQQKVRLDAKPGIYLITIENNGQTFKKKVYIQ